MIGSLSDRDASAIGFALAGLKSQMGGLGNLLANPITRLGVRYWWAAVPVGMALWSQYKEQKASGGVKLHTLLANAGAVLSPVVSLVILLEFARQAETRTQGVQQ
jgi:hypothetical protein